jgi:opacity protein-like surface antigen
MITSMLVGLLVTLLPGLAWGTGLGLGARYSFVHNRDTDDNANMLGAMARLRGTFLGLEGAVDYRNEDLGNNVELKTWPISASLMLYPIPAIYGLAGVGWYNSTIDFPAGSLYEDDTDTELGYHFGAGLEMPLAPTLKLTGDFRYLFVDYEFDDIPSTIGKVDANSLAITAGLIVYLR